ncbi:hypothetical protein KY359_06220, partial [Candidatus Woesearchaeota archaeon]|nr:hypothetical protein [Candidatus Woesearchaeota archaeon]
YIEGVELRTDEDPDVRPYIQEMNVKWLAVELPDEFRRVQHYLKQCYESKLHEVKKHGYINSSQVHNGKTQILKLQGFLHSEIAKGDKSFEIMKSVSLLAEAMKAEHALELLETQGITPLFNYFEKIYEEGMTSKVKAVKNLTEDLNFKSAFIVTRKLREDGVDHPKLLRLKELVEAEVGQNPHVKIIIFNQYRESAKKIHETLSTISGAQARIFVGQAKKNGVGLSQKEQKQMLEDFKAGEFNCLVATSVAEEGIDIPCVDLVVFYEPVPSGIRTIQRRGRTGRQEKGRVVVLMTKGTRDEGYKWSAHHKEKRMYRELENLKKRFTLLGRHEEAKLERFIAPDMQLNVWADYREKASGVVKELIDMGISMNMKQLDIGDYMLSPRVCIEYKKVPDFVDSIIDGRLLEQIRNLKHHYDRPMIIIEGAEDMYALRKIAPNAIRGMLATIMVSYGIPVIQTKTPKETAALMAVVAKREQDPDSREFNPHGSKKPMTTHELQEYIVSALPGIGPTLAKPLLEKFGTVRAIVNASEDELQEIEKIGDKKAKEIQRLLTEKYENRQNN